MADIKIEMRPDSGIARGLVDGMRASPIIDEF